MALIILVASFYLLYAVKDPDLKTLHRTVSHGIDEEGQEVELEAMPLREKMGRFTAVVLAELKSKPVLLMCLVGTGITKLLTVLFSTYLILWIQSFPDFSDGARSKNVYFNMLVISVAISSLVLPLLGRYIDSSPAIKLVPYAFMSRCVCCYLFSMLRAPDTVAAYAVCVLIIISTIFESNLIDSIFAKSLGKAARGLLFGLQMFFCNLGLLIFSVSGGWLFDHVGPKSPFILIGVLDFIFALYAAYLTYKHRW